jgi:glycogen(starch) synthase
MLSWEYPPLVVGGLGRHVDALSRALVAAGHEVCVVTRGAGPEAEEQIRHGVRVCRAAADPVDIGFTTETLLAWSQANEHALLRAALPVVRRWAPDVVHAHDWLVAQSAITLAQVTGAPVVATIHALEAGRHQGWLPAPLNRAIHSVERWLVAEAATVITCSGFMQDEVTRRFDVDPSRIRVVPNGIDTGQWATTSASREAARAPYGPAPLVVFAGRLVHEKGLQTLVAALPALRRAHPGLRLVVAGTGPLEAELRARARSLRVARMISWAGFLGEDALLRLLAAADLAVVPSFYEPFGLVALEAAAAGTPLVVADTGGLRDLVVDGVTGARFPSGDPGALAQVISRTLAEPARARGLANRARRRAREQFSWPAVASRTAVVYEHAAPKLGIVASS